MKKRQQIKVECVKFIDHQKEIHAVGFIIKETADFIVISLTRSYGKYLDTLKISKKMIISRAIPTLKR
ncbi:MAG: hypothetical protein Q8Q03_00245 [bacterium]|nr:hypothetical protein [bacterium]